MDDRAHLEVLLQAQRAILRARRPADVVDALEQLVQQLGGRVVDADTVGDEVLPLDLGLGVRTPRLPWAPPGEPARRELERLLPPLVEDAARTVHLQLEALQRVDAAHLDDRTGALHEAATMRLFGRAPYGSLAIGVRLLDPAGLEGRYGRVRVEQVLRELVVLLRGEVDVDERVGRIGPSDLAVVIPNPAPHRARTLANRVLDRWQRERTLTADIATRIVVVGDPEHTRTMLRSDPSTREAAVGTRGTT